MDWTNKNLAFSFMISRSWMILFRFTKKHWDSLKLKQEKLGFKHQHLVTLVAPWEFSQKNTWFGCLKMGKNTFKIAVLAGNIRWWGESAATPLWDTKPSGMVFNLKLSEFSKFSVVYTCLHDCMICGFQSFSCQYHQPRTRAPPKQPLVL